MVKLYRDLFCEYVCRQTIMLYTQAVIVSEKPRDVFLYFLFTAYQLYWYSIWLPLENEKRNTRTLVCVPEDG